MKKIGKYAAMFALAWTFLFGVEVVCDIPITEVSVEAHSGRTDSSGGHKDNKNKSGLGSYHYHCGGYPAHLHENGVCPYAAPTVEAATQTTVTTSTETSNSTVNTKKNKASKSDVKEVQEALNVLGYDCGKPDGICGKTTKKRIKEFQKDIGVTVDGIVDEDLMEILGCK